MRGVEGARLHHRAQAAPQQLRRRPAGPRARRRGPRRRARAPARTARSAVSAGATSTGGLAHRAGRRQVQVGEVGLAARAPGRFGHVQAQAVRGSKASWSSSLRSYGVGQPAARQRHQTARTRPNTPAPAKRARAPRRSSMRSASFHLAMRSLRAKEPTFSWPDAPADAPGARWWCPRSRRSAPRRCRHSPARAPPASSASVSVSVPRWLGLSSTQLAAPAAAASRSSGACDTSKSSPTTCSLRPDGAREAREAVQVVLGQRVLDARRSGKRSIQRSSISIMPSAVELAPVQRPAGSGRRGRTREAAMSSAMATCSPGAKPPRSMAASSVSSACSLLSKAGHQPPSSATPCSGPRRCISCAGGAVDLGRPFQRLRKAAWRPGTRP